MKKFGIIALAVLASSLLAACGEKPDPTSQTAPPGDYTDSQNAGQVKTNAGGTGKTRTERDSSQRPQRN